MYTERYELSTGRIREIQNETTLEEPVLSYFQAVSAFALRLSEVYGHAKRNELCKLSAEELKALNRELFQDIIGDYYQSSYANPAYIGILLKNNDCNLKMWQYLNYLYVQLRGLIPYAYEGKLEYLTLYFELFIEAYGIFVRSEESVAVEKELYEAIYWFERDNLDIFVREGLCDKLDPERDFALRLILGSDLSDTRYLYLFSGNISRRMRPGLPVF